MPRWYAVACHWLLPLCLIMLLIDASFIFTPLLMPFSHYHCRRLLLTPLLRCHYACYALPGWAAIWLFDWCRHHLLVFSSSFSWFTHITPLFLRWCRLMDTPVLFHWLICRCLAITPMPDWFRMPLSCFISMPSSTPFLIFLRAGQPLDVCRILPPPLYCYAWLDIGLDDATPMLFQLLSRFFDIEMPLIGAATPSTPLRHYFVVIWLMITLSISHLIIDWSSRWLMPLDGFAFISRHDTIGLRWLMPSLMVIISPLSHVLLSHTGWCISFVICFYWLITPSIFSIRLSYAVPIIDEPPSSINDASLIDFTIFFFILLSLIVSSLIIIDFH